MISTKPAITVGPEGVVGWPSKMAHDVSQALNSTPWSLGMGNLQPLVGNPYNGYINPYYWVDDHPLLYGNDGSLDPIAHVVVKQHIDILSLS